MKHVSTLFLRRIFVLGNKFFQKNNVVFLKTETLMKEVMDIKDFFKEIIRIYGTFQEDILNLIVFIFTNKYKRVFLNLTKNGH